MSRWRFLNKGMGISSMFRDMTGPQEQKSDQRQSLARRELHSPRRDGGQPGPKGTSVRMELAHP